MFFSQQGVTNNSFPCNTVAGSRIGSRNITEWCWSTIKVGLAPSLLSTWGSTTPWAEAWAGIIKISCLCDPNQMILVLKVTNINREELTFSSCTSLDDVTPWCYTRIQVGRVSFPNFSNCRKTCWPLTATGVTARLPAPGSCPLPPASTVSLLDQIFGTLRSSTSPPGVLAFATHMIRPQRWLLFDCQPQNPLLLLFKVEPGVSGQLYALLGHQWVPFYLCFLYGISCISPTFSRDKVVLVDEFLGFNIYLHDKGQFWPGLEMGELILHSFPFLRLHPRSSGIELCQVLAKGHRVGRKLWGHLKENRSDMVAKTFAQVRKKTLLNKEDIACSEVIPSFWPIFNPGPQLLVPILRSQLGRQRGRMPLRLVQVSIYEQFDFFETIVQQLAHQWGRPLLPDRGCNQLSKCLVKGSAGESSSTPSPPV